MKALLAAFAVALALATACGGGGDDDCVVSDDDYQHLPAAGEDASPPLDVDAGPTEPDASVACHCC